MNLRRVWLRVAWHFQDQRCVRGAPPRFNIINTDTGRGYAGFNRWHQPVFTTHRQQWIGYGSAGWAQRTIDDLGLPNLRPEPIQ